MGVPEPQLNAWRSLLDAQAAVVSRAERALADAGLPPLSWYDVLWELFRAPDRKLRMHELAELLTIRRSGGEAVLMLGGGRALLMQAAHPLVAAGIVEHSRYAEEPWRRLARTMVALYTVVHGTKADADAVAAQVRGVHARVAGVANGRRYSALDPELQLWVHSTLVDTGLVVYET